MIYIAVHINGHPFRFSLELFPSKYLPANRNNVCVQGPRNSSVMFIMGSKVFDMVNLDNGV